MPSGAQETLEGERLHLTWTHPLDFSDSGVYECVAVNEEGESTASVDMTVICECGSEERREGGNEGREGVMMLSPDVCFSFHSLFLSHFIPPPPRPPPPLSILQMSL